MTTIEIRVCHNGYMACEGLSRDNPIQWGPPNVFETYGNLLQWMKDNLDKPLEQSILAKNEAAKYSGGLAEHVMEALKRSP